MRGLGAIFLAVLVAGTVGCGERREREEPAALQGVIVRVGDAVLTEEMLENLLPEGERVPITSEEKKRFVQRWIDREVLYQEALRRGLKDDPRVSTRLRSLEQEFLADHFAFIELRERTLVTEDEIEKYFREHEKEYKYEYRVSHILVSTIEEAEKVLELLENNSFAWVANRQSIDPVARRGGDLGYLSKGNMIAEFESVVFELKPGETSGIVRSDFGYHIIKLVGTRESLVTVDLVDVREQIMNRLLMDRRASAYREFLVSLRNRAGIEYLDQSYAEEASAAPFEEEADTASAWDEEPVEGEYR